MMPWVKIGRYRFDLDDVALVVDVVGQASNEDLPSGVTVKLRTRLGFDLAGSDADLFTQVFDRHVASQSIGEKGASSPGLVIESHVVFPPGSAYPGEFKG